MSVAWDTAERARREERIDALLELYKRGAISLDSEEVSELHRLLNWQLRESINHTQGCVKDAGGVKQEP